MEPRVFRLQAKTGGDRDSQALASIQKKRRVTERDESSKERNDNQRGEFLKRGPRQPQDLNSRYFKVFELPSKPLNRPLIV